MKRDRLSRDILGIFSTRVVWASMGMISGIILARWLGPHERGILALVLLIPSTVVTLTKLGVSQANIYSINRKKVSVDQVASNSILLALVLGTAASSLVWVGSGNVLSSILQEVPPAALAVALARVPLLLLDNYLFSVLQATGKFKTYNVRLLLSEALRLALVILAIVVLGLGLHAAVAIFTFVSAVNVAWLLAAMRHEIRFSLSLDRTLLGETLSFGARSYVQVVTSHLLLRLDVYMVSHFLGAAPTAFYSIALHLTELVLEFPQAVGLVLYPRLASLPENEVHRLTAQACRRTLMVSLPAAAALAFLGPYLIVLWYGAPYAPAGDPLPWAAVAVVMMSVFVILTRDFTSRGQQRINIIAGQLALLLNIVLNVLLIPVYGIVGAAGATAASYSAASLVLMRSFLTHSDQSLGQVLLPRREDFDFMWNLTRGAVSRLPLPIRPRAARRKKTTHES